MYILATLTAERHSRRRRRERGREISTDRYETERRQGEDVAHRDLERVWGWTSAAGRVRAARRTAFLTDAARLGPGVRCLEVGCGTGEFTVRISESGCDLTAVDVSEATAAVAQSRVGAAATVIVGNVETGDGLGDDPFDAIVGVSVLHHLNMELFFESTFSLLKPGGRFAFSEPNLANPQIWAERNVAVVGKLRHVTEHETAFRVAELRQLFQDAGAIVETCEAFEFLHPATPRPLIPTVARIEGLLERSPLRAIAGSIRIAGHKQ